MVELPSRPSTSVKIIRKSRHLGPTTSSMTSSTRPYPLQHRIHSARIFTQYSERECGLHYRRRMSRGATAHPGVIRKGPGPLSDSKDPAKGKPESTTLQDGSEFRLFIYCDAPNSCPTVRETEWRPASLLIVPAKEAHLLDGVAAVPRMDPALTRMRYDGGFPTPPRTRHSAMGSYFIRSIGECAISQEESTLTSTHPPTG